MPPALVGSADANNKYEDLSGIDTSSATNPYDALIQACDGDPVSASGYLLVLQERYNLTSISDSNFSSLLTAPHATQRSTEGVHAVRQVYKAKYR